ncbi:TAXI family TRAP transporter solute-binding subunit [Marinobacterium arenosum]|uniref:TAXI family TRAP transporter solute-binding subunit n=1 Tax=Marinobacterium arenosum TaxID=2862496 RepID=UPI001C939FB4|nr:TAXI family TRAP transporter solute-binding subunit [Marinobacterium arenosum]MBY4676403.1 TAXI family TRAP transporter solute-binding subunit [Marinobacterium arenosum]
MSLKNKLASTLLSSSVALAAGFGASAASAEQTYVTIGTGGQTGVYYVVGQSICRLVNRGTEEHNLKCTAPSTGGSVVNINAIREGQQDMGMAQSDWQYYAMKGTKHDSFKAAGPFKELRALFAVHNEPFTVVARADSGIETFDDLVGKRVNLQNPGSGTRGTMELIMAEKGWDKGTFKLAAELKASEQAQALCDNKIDAMLYSVGHPSGAIKEATTSCDSKVIPVTGPVIDKLINSNDFYAQATIPAGLYRGTDKDVTTFGNAATMVASANVDEETVYQVVKAVFDNFDRFKRLHPAFAHLDPQQMISGGLSAPLHDGAVRYYKERGWL